MKKILILIIILLLGVLCGYALINGISLGDFDILSIKQIEQRNDNTDELIVQADKLANSDYLNAMKTLREQEENVKKAKQDYLDKASISTEAELALAYQEISYELETLQVKIGNHARKNGVKIDMRITNSSTSTSNINLFNINFVVNGQYVSISDFVYALENDSELGFKIENFKLIPGSSDTNLQASFLVSDIAINIDKSMVQNSTQTTTTNTDTDTNTDAGTSTDDNATTRPANSEDNTDTTQE